jgi:hypothetical protein
MEKRKKGKKTLHTFSSVKTARKISTTGEDNLTADNQRKPQQNSKTAKRKSRSRNVRDGTKPAEVTLKSRSRNVRDGTMQRHKEAIGKRKSSRDREHSDRGVIPPILVDLFHD